MAWGIVVRDEIGVRMVPVLFIRDEFDAGVMANVFFSLVSYSLDVWRGCRF